MAERPFEERWEHIRDLVEHLFREPGRGGVEADVVWYPATDVYETETEFVVRMDLSGVRRDELEIVLKNGALHVRGIRRDPAPRKRKTFHKIEIAMGPFVRSIQVPTRFAAAAASADYRDGVLEIKLTARPGSKPVEIFIEVV